MPYETRDHGELRVTFTNEFDWKYNEQGTRARSKVTFYHAKPQGDLRPLGSFVSPSHQDHDDKRATILLGNAPNSNMTAVASPTEFSQIWNDLGSNGTHDGSIWMPNPPPGYVPLGHVCTTGYSAPSTSSIWCIRADLALSSRYAMRSIWDDEGSGSNRDVSIWNMTKLPVGGGDFDEDHVFPDLFISNYQHNKPRLEDAWVLNLPEDFGRISVDLATPA